MDEDITLDRSTRRINVFRGRDWTDDYPAFTGWMLMHILPRLRLAGTDIAAEFGGGPGLLAYCLHRHATAMACVDQAAPARAKRRTDGRLTWFRASVTEVASGQARLPHDSYDVMLLRHVLDEITDPAEVIAGLAALLRPGGRMLVVTRPPAIAYPLFAGALELFARLQPDPAGIAAAMAAAGLEPELGYDSFKLAFSARKWQQMVAERYAPLLSHFDDIQLEAGLAEIRQAQHGSRVAFEDTFAFILGTAA